MLAFLLQRTGLLARLAWLLLLLSAAQPAAATHLLGGEMTYRYLDAQGPAGAPLRYEITVTVYNNCGAAGIAQPKSQAVVAIYAQGTGTKIQLATANSAYATARGDLNIPQTTISECIAPPIPPGCTVIGVSQPYRLQRFIAIVNLPASSAGYYALFSDSARNVDITNLFAPNTQSLTLYVSLLPPTIPNSAPVFSDVAVAVICANDTTFLLNNAVDADGDRLVYSFGQPYAQAFPQAGPPAYFTPTPTLAAYSAGASYSASAPFGTAPGNFASINPATGLATYGASTAGSKYVVAVDVKEYRTINGQEQLIGTTRRDLQLVVGVCPPARAPAVPPSITPRDYTVEAGRSITIPFAATQADHHPLVLTLNSELLDGAGGHNASFDGNPGTRLPGYPTGTVTAAGPTGAVGGTLTFSTTCAEARATPYDVAFTVKDNGCAGKTTADVLHITVTPPPGPQRIVGDPLVCALNARRTYRAVGNTAPQISWRVAGGTIVGSRTADSVQVQWGEAGTGTLAVHGISQLGCLTDSVVQQVIISEVAALPVAGSRRICPGCSTTLTPTGGLPPYTVTGPDVLLTGPGPFVLSPAQTTTYTVTGSTSPTNCGATSQVTVTVLPHLRVPNAISPNGDGENDTWQIANIDDYPTNHVLIFNRWGNKVFEASNYSPANEWNGTLGGQPAPAGTYYYVISLSEGQSQSGSLTVVY